MKVLLIEDDEVDAQIFQHAVDKVTGVEIRWAKNAKEGLARLESGEFEIVVSDLHVPGNGADLIRELKQFGRPIVVWTGSDDGERLKEVSETGGVCEHIAKSDPPWRIEAAVARLPYHASKSTWLIRRAVQIASEKSK